MSKFRQPINCHSHTHYSLDGAASPEDIILRNKELGATHVAVTEHGNLNSALEHYEKSIKHGIKPIVGIELYIIPPFIDELRQIITSEIDAEKKYKSPSDREAKIEKALKGEYAHLTIHFKDEWAYNYFTTLTPKMEERALVKWGERKPMATLEEVAGAAGHIVVCSSCLVGVASKYLVPRRKSKTSRPDLAEKAYLMIREIAGKENFFVEIFPHIIDKDWKRPEYKEGKLVKSGEFVPHECTPMVPDGDIQKLQNSFMLDMADRHGDPVLVSLDSHFATPSQELVQISKLSNGDEAWRFSNSYHVMSADESYEILEKQLKITPRTMEQWIDNSYRFASMFDNFRMTTAKDRLVLQTVDEGWQDRLIGLISKHGRMVWNDDQMMARLKHEIDTLASNGNINLIPYFFTVEDVADFCKRNGILMTARGSGGGSLLAYLLGISSVNPLKYGLSFARFINAGRILKGSLPDIDSDIAEQGRVFEYIKQKYGDAAARISVDQMLKLKTSIKDAERTIYGSVRPETERLTKSLPIPPQGVDDYDFTLGYIDDSGAYNPGLIEMHDGLKTYAERNPRVWEMVKECMGTVRQKSAHACGVVIADKPLQQYIPMTNVGGELITGFSPKQLESAGLVKFDFLGLNTLRDIQDTIKVIKERHGVDIDPFNLPDDPRVWELFGRGETATVFQFDTDVVRPYLINTQPTRIEHLSALTALCRPGTLQAPESLEKNARPLSLVYVSRAQGEQTKYIHPDLEPILGDTYGIQLYQEQTIRLFTDLAGYSEGQADDVRRAIGKKDAKVLSSATADLKEKCLARGWTEGQVDLLISQIMASSRYSFNKSHSTAYAINAFACMWLKANYPVEWWSSILSNSSKDDLVKYWKEVGKYVIMPDVNRSNDKFQIVSTPDGDKILAPLTIIDGLGAAVVTEIAKKQPFSSVDDFITRINRTTVKKNIVYKMIYGGVMDSLFPEGVIVEEKIDYYLKRKAELLNEKPEPTPAEYTSLSGLKKFLMKRQVFKVYQTNIDDIAMPILIDRKIIKPSSHPSLPYRYTYPDPQSHKQQEYGIINDVTYKKYYETDEHDSYFAMVGYVVDAEEKKWEANDNGQKVMKSMMKIYLEVGSSIIEGIKWPNWGTTEHGISKDIEGGVALIVYKKSPNKKEPTILKVLPIEKI